MGRRGPELDPHLRTRICELRNTAKWSYRAIQKAYPTISLSTIHYTVQKEHEREKNQSKSRPGKPRKPAEGDREKNS